MTTTSPEITPLGVTGQTFLVGETIYLRPIVEADAPFAASWRQTLFPVSPEITETWIKEEMAKTNPWSGPLQLGILRKHDDRIIGSLAVYGRDFDHWIYVRVDPLLGDSGQTMQGEAVVLAADWLINECGQPVVHLEVAATDKAYINHLLAGGFRQSARFREMLLRDGQRTDRLIFDMVGSRWVDNLGDPYEAPLPRTGTGQPRPVPPKVTVAESDLPKNAVMVGERVYLRPEQVSDGALAALRGRQETETFFDIGRHLTASTQYEDWIKKHEKKNPPTWITFAACLRENDLPIGWVGLLDIDYQNGFAESGSFFGDPAYRGGGYGSEAKQLLLEYGFERLGLHMVQSWVYFPNTRSAAALRKQGYQEAGRINWLYSHEGTLDNFVAFDLLAEDWRAMPREAWKHPNAS